MHKVIFIFCAILNFSFLQIFAQVIKKSTYKTSGAKKGISKPLYSARPNHLDLVAKSFNLAVSAGFNDTSGISSDEILERLKAGAYCEDYDIIPGIIGEHFPVPWDKGPTFDFNGLYPIARIPYGPIEDTLSGWFRGYSHGYDPVTGFKWPGAVATTIEWANSSLNSLSWDKAITLYKAGSKAEAYECLGHLLHLLEDMSIPAHIKVINHGISINKLKSGTIVDPDLLTLIVDEYELALAGGITLHNVISLIPDLTDDFTKAFNSSKIQDIPHFNDWKDYLINLALYTYNDKTVNKNYTGPGKGGEWGNVIDENGNTIQPKEYGITPPSKIGDRWVQISVKSTASITGGSIISKSEMINMCNSFVPKAAVYGAGLILYFFNQVKVTEVCHRNNQPHIFELVQNYPNPFNPFTTITYQLPVSCRTTLKIFNLLGQEVTTLENEVKSAGGHKVEWNASRFASGVYLYQLQAGIFVDTKKLILAK